MGKHKHTAADYNQYYKWLADKVFPSTLIESFKEEDKYSENPDRIQKTVNETIEQYIDKGYRNGTLNPVSKNRSLDRQRDIRNAKKIMDKAFNEGQDGFITTREGESVQYPAVLKEMVDKKEEYEEHLELRETSKTTIDEYKEQFKDLKTADAFNSMRDEAIIDSRLSKQDKRIIVDAITQEELKFAKTDQDFNELLKDFRADKNRGKEKSGVGIEKDQEYLRDLWKRKAEAEPLKVNLDQAERDAGQELPGIREQVFSELGYNPFERELTQDQVEKIRGLGTVDIVDDKLTFAELSKAGLTQGNLTATGFDKQEARDVMNEIKKLRKVGINKLI